LLPGSLKPGKNTPNAEFLKKFNLAECGVAIAEIVYPGKEQNGLLFYFKATMVEGLSSDVYAYKAANPDFPNQSTVDQFFDERQFEAYRELGYKIASLRVKDIASEL